MKRTLGTGLAVLSLVLAACSSSGGATPSTAASASASSGASSGASASASGGAGGSLDPAACKGKTIAVIVKASTSTYWKTVGSGVDQAKKALPGCDVTFEGPDAETNVTEQINEIETNVSKKVAAIVIAPSQAQQVIPSLQKAADAGIPVILIDTNIDFAPKKAFVGTDNEAGGKAAGEYFVKNLKSGDKVAIIRGQAGDPVHNARQKGAEDAMKAAGLNIVAIQPADSDRAKGQTVMENLLQANPDLKAVFCTNDEMALGALQAATQNNKKVSIIGFDASPNAISAIEKGDLTGSIAQFPVKIGQLGVETAVKVIAGQTVEANVNTGVELVTKDNVAKFK